MHDFSENLPDNVSFSVGNQWSFSVYEEGQVVTVPTVKVDTLKSIVDKGLLSILHEIGHLYQEQDPIFRKKYSEVDYGVSFAHLPSEKDAWRRGLELLKKIERKIGSKIIFDEVFMKKVVNDSLASHEENIKAYK